jgi:hypothetical protein
VREMSVYFHQFVSIRGTSGRPGSTLMLHLQHSANRIGSSYCLILFTLPHRAGLDAVINKYAGESVYTMTVSSAICLQQTLPRPK